MNSRIIWFSILGFVFLLVLIKCNVVEKCPDCFTPPDQIGFRMVKGTDSSDLIASGFYNRDSIAIFYFDKGIRKDLELKFYEDTTIRKTIVYTEYMSWNSVAGFKNYYLYLNYKDMDTIYLDVVKKVNDCCTSHPCNSFKYNGEEIYHSYRDYFYYFTK